VDWTALTGTSTGGSTILTYNLYWDNNSGSPTLFLLDSLVTSETITGLTVGSNYIFKVRAKNIYGYGPFSSSVTIMASDVPSTMN
jgi:Fibronectin type III domain